jgi:hypothetical protein
MTMDDENIIQITNRLFEITPVRSSLLPDADQTSNLNPQDIQGLVGTRTHIVHRFTVYPNDNVPYLAFFPYGLGIQTTSVIEAIPPEWDAIFSEPIVPFP